METTKTSHFASQSKSFISIFFTCQVSVCELQPFSCHDLANDIYSQTAKTVFSHLKLIKTGGEVDKKEKYEKLDVIIILQREQNLILCTAYLFAKDS